MKRLFIFISVLILFAAPVLSAQADGVWRRLAVYDLQGNKLLAFPELSIEYYSPDFMVVRDKTNKYYIADKNGKRLNDQSYLVLGYPMITLSDGNFVQLIKAKTVQDNDAEMIIYNKKGEVVFPQDKISNYEPLGFKYLKDGRILGVKTAPFSIVIFETNKEPLTLNTPEKLADWLNKNNIDTNNYKSKWTSNMTDEEKMLTMDENIAENWLNDANNVYFHSMSDLVVFQTRDGAGIRDKNTPTKVIVKPSPEYQQIVIQGNYFAYYQLGKWGLRDLNGNSPSSAKFNNLPILRGDYIFVEER